MSAFRTMRAFRFLRLRRLLVRRRAPLTVSSPPPVSEVVIPAKPKAWIIETNGFDEVDSEVLTNDDTDSIFTLGDQRDTEYRIHAQELIQRMAADLGVGEAQVARSILGATSSLKASGTPFTREESSLRIVQYLTADLGVSELAADRAVQRAKESLLALETRVETPTDPNQEPFKTATATLSPRRGKSEHELSADQVESVMEAMLAWKEQLEESREDRSLHWTRSKNSFRTIGSLSRRGDVFNEAEDAVIQLVNELGHQSFASCADLGADLERFDGFVTLTKNMAKLVELLEVEDLVGKVATACSAGIDHMWNNTNQDSYSTRTIVRADRLEALG